MPLSHLFLIDEISKLNLKLDTSLRVAMSLFNLKHDIFWAQIDWLSWDSSQPGPMVKAIQLEFNGEQDLRFEQLAAKTMSLSKFSAIHMRKDPPFDQTYIATTWFLDQVAETTRVYNNPNSLRTFNEKFVVLNFHNRGGKMSLVSSQLEEMMAFIKSECSNDAVIKPLHLFGGRDIQRLNINGSSEETVRNTLAQSLKKSFPLVVQPFDQKIHEGEVRVFTSFGEPLAWCLKVPEKGSFLANTAAGAKLKPFSPTSTLEDKIKTIAEELLRQQIYFVGFDVIGEEVTEINITSPRMLTVSPDDFEPFSKMAFHIDQDLSR